MDSAAKQTSADHYDELPYLSSSGPPLGPNRNLHFIRDQMIKRHTEERRKYPFSQDCLGHRNPYNNTIINFDFEYYEYLREHTYYMFCDEELQTEKAHAKEDAVNACKDEIALADSTIKTLKKELLLSETKHKHTHRLLLLTIAVLLIFSVLTCCDVISFDSRSPASSYDEGYAAGKTAGYQSGYAAGKKEGYASGQTDGYHTGKNDGFVDGYQEGYSDGESGVLSWWEQFNKTNAMDDTSSRQSVGGNIGATRDEPIADAYIGNKSSKKFHLPTCSYLPDAANQITFDSRDDAIAAGYSPCGHCHP